MKNTRVNGRQKVTWIGMLLLAVGLCMSACDNREGKATDDAEEPEVEVFMANEKPFTPVTELPGRIEAYRTAIVRAQVKGIVLKRHFEEGGYVEAGDVLFEIDPRPYRALLERAEAECARADAALEQAKSVAERYISLIDIAAVSQQDVDTAQSEVKSAEANKALAEAEVATARLNLEYATVTAPISGRIGRALVSEGALVGQDEATPLAMIQQLDIVYVEFKQSVADTLDLRSLVEHKKAEQGKPSSVPISVRIDGTDKTKPGHLLFLDTTVDKGTGQISLHGLVNNRDSLLLPGMYVKVLVEKAQDDHAIFVPQRAVSLNKNNEPQVLVVNADSIVESRQVETGTMRGADWYIRQGLKAGDRVIVGGAGMGSVQPGKRVRVSRPAASPL